MAMEKLVPALEKLGINLYRMAFYQDGHIEDHCFRPVSNCSNCYSVAKLFAVTAVGFLHDEGLLDVKKPIREYMADLMPADIDPAWQTVTTENAITHKVGYGKGFLDIDVEDVSEYPTKDYLSMVFRHPMVYQPGEKYQYSDAAFYLVSRLISCVSGEKADVYLNRRLFQPLGFHEAAWSRCPQDYPMGATGLYISAHDMVKLGALYVDGGLWRGKRILSEEWVRMAIENEYEIKPKTPSGWIGKGGMNGQMLMFHPEKRCAVGWHAFCTSDEAQQVVECIDRLI